MYPSYLSTHIQLGDYVLERYYLKSWSHIFYDGSVCLKLFLHQICPSIDRSEP